MISIRCSDVDEVLRALDDLSLHQTVASPSPRINGFVTQIMTWEKTYARACHIFVGVIAVDLIEAEFDDGDLELEKVFMEQQC